MSDADETPQIETAPAEDQSNRPSRFRTAIVFSVLVHVVIVAAALLWYLPSLYQPKKTSPAGSAASGQGENRVQASPESSAKVPDDLVQKSLEQQMDQSKELTDQEKLSELEKNLKKLDEIANPASVQQVSEKIGSSLGLDTQAYQPKPNAAEGPFDPETAQLLDVSRRKHPNGQWIYTSQMVDAQGRKMQVPVSAADGETLYNTFQQMKKFPMAAGIYRSVVMPMMQRMLEAEDFARKAKTEAERLRVNDESSGPAYD